MKPENTKDLLELTDKRKVKFRRELFVYLFFLFISVILWYFIALSREIKTQISYPVIYQDMPSGKALIVEVPEKLVLNVEGIGFMILRSKLLSYYRPIVINVDNFRLDILRKGNRYQYLLATKFARDAIAGQIGSEIRLIKILPDTLRFVFTEVVEKKVPIKPLLKVEYEKQYLPSSKLIVEPESIVVAGPQLYVDTIQFAYTKELKLDGIKDTFTKELEIDKFSKLTYSKSKIWVMQPVEKYTELAVNVPIEVENVPSNLKVKTFPGYIGLTCMVAISNFDQINLYSFKATIDYLALNQLKQSKVKVNLTKSPSNVSAIKFMPKSVEYLIEK